MRHLVRISIFTLAGVALVGTPKALAGEGKTCIDCEDHSSTTTPTTPSTPPATTPGSSSSSTSTTSSSSTSTTDDSSSSSDDDDSSSSSSSSSGSSMFEPHYTEANSDPAPPPSAWNDPSQSVYVSFDMPSGDNHMLVSFANREPSAQELGAEADDADNASSYRSQQQNNLAFGDEPPPPTSNNVGFAPVTVSAPVAPANVATVPDTSSDPPTPPSTTAPALASPPTPHALDIANTVLPAMQDQLVNSWAAGQQRAGGKVLIAVADQTGSAASGDADARTVDAISAPTEEAARNLFGPVAWLANTNAAMEQAPQHVREWFDGRVQALKDSGTRVYMQVLRAFSSSAPAPTDDNDDCGAPGGSCRR